MARFYDGTEYPLVSTLDGFEIFTIYKDGATHTTTIQDVIDQSNASSVLSDLSNVTITNPQEEHVLQYIGGEWVNSVIETGTTSVATLAELITVTGGDGEVAFMADRTFSGDGGGGTFIFDSSDLSTEVAGDVLQGIYVAPSSDVTGTSGAWVRQHRPDYRNLLWFGSNVTPETTDFYPMIRAALDSYAPSYGGIIDCPGGPFYISQTVGVDRPVQIIGSNNGHFSGWSESATRFVFAADTTGFWFQRASQSVGGDAGDYATLENLTIEAVSKSGYAHGILMNARAVLTNVTVFGFSGNGCHIYGSALADPSTNANLWRIDNCKFSINDGHGLFVDGPDANAGVATGLNCTDNGGWGVLDSSFLGNTYIAPHTNGNSLGAYRNTNNNAPSPFIGAYSESNQLGSDLGDVGTFVGGRIGSRVYAPSDDKLSSEVYNANRSAILYCHKNSGGSGYTGAPGVTIDPPAPTTGATATATVVDGVIVSVTVVDGGNGYSTLHPTVNIVDGTGSGAILEASIGRGSSAGGDTSVQRITVLDGGSNYTSPVITIDPPIEIQATGTAFMVNGEVGYIVLNNAGSGYTSDANITLAGGGGSGASFTAKIPDENDRTIININGNESNGDILSVVNSATGLGGTGATFRLRCENNYTSGDMKADWNNLGSARVYRTTGPYTQQTFGRVSPLPYAFQVEKLIHGGGRLIDGETDMPTTGEYARGDFVYNTEPTIIDNSYVILGWSRLVRGTDHVLGTDWAESRVFIGEAGAVRNVSNIVADGTESGIFAQPSTTTDINNVDVWVNGIKLVRTTEYTSDGTNITITNPTIIDQDDVEIITWE